MEKKIEIENDGSRQKVFIEGSGVDKDKVQTVFENEEVLKANHESRKETGFDITHTLRLVARINMNTVRLLAINRKDADAMAYLNYHDTDARDRMIRHYPHLFKACSGGV